MKRDKELTPQELADLQLARRTVLPGGCSECGGYGTVIQPADEVHNMRVLCPVCAGSGKAI
jgi:DnaJ-class molecular chaperone